MRIIIAILFGFRSCRIDQHLRWTGPQSSRDRMEDSFDAHLIKPEFPIDFLPRRRVTSSEALLRSRRLPRDSRHFQTIRGILKTWSRRRWLAMNNRRFSCSISLFFFFLFFTFCVFPSKKKIWRIFVKTRRNICETFADMEMLCCKIFVFLIIKSLILSYFFFF